MDDLDFYGYTKQLFKEISQQIVQGQNEICFWAANAVCKALIVELERQGLMKDVSVTLVDKAPEKWGEELTLGWKIEPPEVLQSRKISLLVVCSDRMKEAILSDFAKLTTQKPEVILFGNGHISFVDPDYQAVAHMTGGASIRKQLFQALKFVLQNRVPGSLLELGVGAANTTPWFGQIVKNFGQSHRTIHGIDTFAGFPERAHLFDLDMVDINAHYRNDCSLQAAQSRCAAYSNIHLHQGDVEERIKDLSGETFALSFFDMDNYTPTKAALRFVYERTPLHGILAFDHFDVGGERIALGQRMAIKEFLQEMDGYFLLHGTNILMKCR